jgi:hypothetical protein
MDFFFLHLKFKDFYRKANKICKTFDFSSGYMHSSIPIICSVLLAGRCVWTHTGDELVISK